MKRPNLTYNYYFPYYTQKITGKKKYFYRIDTTMHISEEMGIFISLSYKQNKISEVLMERISDRGKLHDASMDGKHITYMDFAGEVRKAYTDIDRAMKILSPEQAYIKKLFFSSYFMYNESLEFELEYRKIKITNGEYKYRIENGRKSKEERNYDDSEEGLLMKEISNVVNLANGRTSYHEIDKKEFENKLNYEWDYFIEYFESPKFLKKSEYRPK